MERPSFRQLSVPPKGNGSEARKDGVVSKQRWQGRRGKEGPRGPPRPDPSSRVPAALKLRQEGRNVRGRGYQDDWQRQEVRDEELAELGSTYRPGSKKGNLNANHLLQFTFAPREGDGLSRVGGLVGKGGRFRSRLPTFNKEQFLQANCQFLVRAGGDYDVHLSDPDKLVEWSDIEQVCLYATGGTPACPICLFPPTAARMTRCGHIYCWACILHYLSLEEEHKTWRKCPICYEAVHSADLKSVVVHERTEHSVGEMMTLRLMRRERGATQARPAHSSGAPCDGLTNMEDSLDTCFLKLVEATPTQVGQLLEAERAVLGAQLQDEGGPTTLEGSYVQAALDALATRASSVSDAADVDRQLRELDLTSSSPSLTSSSGSGDEAGSPPRADIKKGLSYADAFDDVVQECARDMGACTLGKEAETDDSVVEESFIEDSVVDEVLMFEEMLMEDMREYSDEKSVSGDVSRDDALGDSIAESPNVCEAPTPSEEASTLPVSTDHYYYQASDGQHVYLHSVNARCLVAQYGSWAACPDVITAPVVQQDRMTLTQELRSRLRYVSHLPLCAELGVVELHLAPPLVYGETLAKFQIELDKRRRARQRKSRDEARFGRQMAAEEDRRAGRQKGLRVPLESARHFPQYSSCAQTEPSAQPPRPPSVASNASSGFTSPGTSRGSSPAGPRESSAVSPMSSSEISPAGPKSFAQMLSVGGPNPVRPQRGAAPAWPRARQPAPPEEEGVGVVPDYKAAVGVAIQHALDAYSHTPEGDATQAGKKKKKKKKEVTLLAW